MEIKPITPKFNALNRTHKEDKHIRSVISNIEASSYKLADILVKNLTNYKLTIYIGYQKL
jgi:hypothetical protein